jgi:hypothetical protein
VSRFRAYWRRIIFQPSRWNEEAFDLCLIAPKTERESEGLICSACGWQITIMMLRIVRSVVVACQLSFNQSNDPQNL